MSGSFKYDKMFRGSLINLSTTSTLVGKAYKEIIFHNEKTSDIKGSKYLRLISWNLLASPYKRDKKSKDEWRHRTRAQIKVVGESNADVIGLQEFWVQNEEYLRLWRVFASIRGYTMFVSPRTRNKADGCCMLVRLREASLKTFSYNDWGDRIAQVVRGKFGDEEVALVQTHLTFPHPTPQDGPMRWHQGKKLGEFVGNLNVPNIILFGDVNSPNGAADPAMRNIITFGKLKDYGPKGLVSHLSHAGDKMACDFVFSSGCRLIQSWLGETEEELVNKKLLSDHRSCHAVLSFKKLDNHPASYAGLHLENRNCRQKLMILNENLNQDAGKFFKIVV